MRERANFFSLSRLGREGRNRKKEREREREKGEGESHTVHNSIQKRREHEKGKEGRDEKIDPFAFILSFILLLSRSSSLSFFFFLVLPLFHSSTFSFFLSCFHSSTFSFFLSFIFLSLSVQFYCIKSFPFAQLHTTLLPFHAIDWIISRFLKIGEEGKKRGRRELELDS